MKFVSFKRLAKEVSISVQKIDDVTLQQVSEKTTEYFSKNSELLIGNRSFRATEVFFLLHQLKDDKVKVFHDWMEQDATVCDYLHSNGAITPTTQAVKTPKEHVLFFAYQSFCTEFLAPLMTKKMEEALTNKDLRSIPEHLHFSELITKDKRVQIQLPVVMRLRQKIQMLSVSQPKVMETRIPIVFSSLFVRILNKLDENYYSDLVAFVDTGKQLVSGATLSASSLNRIKKTMLQLDLNEKHHQQVRAFCQSDVFSKPVKSSRNQLKSWVRSPLFFVALIAIFINFYFFYGNNAKETIVENDNETYGIDSLNQEELDKTDEMFGYKDDSTEATLERLPAAIAPQYILTAKWDRIKNKKARLLIQNMVTDYQLQKNAGFSDCPTTPKKLYGEPLYQGVDSISSRKGSKYLFTNESHNDVYVLVIEPTLDGKVFGTLVAPCPPAVPAGRQAGAAQRSTNLQLEKGDQVVFYTGLKMNTFQPMQTKNGGYGNIDDAKKISKGFDHHFCSISVIDFQQFNIIYTVGDVNGEIVFKEMGNGGFEVSGDGVEAR